MNSINFQDELVNLLKQFVIDNGIEHSLNITEDTRLIGSNSIFDSMELVQFIVEVESFLQEKLNIEIQLANEKAMSKRNSPFISIKSLNIYINEIINE
jgi:hypothetical protein